MTALPRPLNLFELVYPPLSQFDSPSVVGVLLTTESSPQRGRVNDQRGQLRLRGSPMQTLEPLNTSAKSSLRDFVIFLIKLHRFLWGFWVAEAAHECKHVPDAVEKIFYLGIPDVQVDNRFQETISQAVELLPELWKQGSCYQRGSEISGPGCFSGSK